MSSIIISFFCPHFASTMSSGNFRAGLYKHPGKEVKRNKLLICFMPTVKCFFKAPHQARGWNFWGGNMMNHH